MFVHIVWLGTWWTEKETANKNYIHKYFRSPHVDELIHSDPYITCVVHWQFYVIYGSDGIIGKININFVQTQFFILAHTMSLQTNFEYWIQTLYGKTSDACAKLQWIFYSTYSLLLWEMRVLKSSRNIFHTGSGCSKIVFTVQISKMTLMKHRNFMSQRHTSSSEFLNSMPCHAYYRYWCDWKEL